MTLRPPRRQLLLARAGLGLVGIVLLVPAIVVVLSLGTGDPLDPMGGWVRATQGAINRTERVLVRVQDTLRGASSTLDDAASAANDTAAMTDALGNAMNDLAAASSVQVLGITPFAGLAPQFTQLGTRAAAVGTSLRSTARSVQGTRGDLDRLTAEVRSLATLAQQAASGQAGAAGPTLAIARILVALLLAWMAAGAGLAVVEARALLRAAPLP